MCLNLVCNCCNCCNLHTKKSSYLFKIYYYIMAAIIWKGDILLYNSLIYFITDLFNETILTMLLLTLFTDILNIKVGQLLGSCELSSIPLALFHMGYIPKPIYNLVFSYSFIGVRLIYYNYTMYMLYLTDRELFTNTVIGFYTLFNIMNCGIAWKMKLVQKLFAIRPAIDYLRDKTT